MKPIHAFFLIIVAGLGVLASSSLFIVREWEQVIITRFGDPVATHREAGIKLKAPFIDTVNRIERRVLEWDGEASEMPTRDKLFVIVDTFARWSVSDPQTYLERLRDEASARSRLNAILGSETRDAVAAHDLIEIIRTTPDRQPDGADEIVEILGEAAMLEPIETGRPAIEERIFNESVPKLAEFGIELLDIRFKRINYNPDVETDIHQRMISERQQIAERFRSEGRGEAERILGNMERDVNRIQSEAYRRVQEITGEAEAEATNIYAAALNQSADSVEFYRFLRTMETYRTSLGDDTTVLLSTDSPLLQYLRNGGEPVPVTPLDPVPAPPQTLD